MVSHLCHFDFLDLMLVPLYQIDKLRLSATMALAERRDVVIVASEIGRAHV